MGKKLNQIFINKYESSKISEAIMAQKISQGNIFGRIGTGIGQGLAEQVPKEIENYRLRTGLKSLADEADRGELSPSQYLARAAGTYGVTPQMIQSFSELAKQQNLKNAYNKLNTGQVPRDIHGKTQQSPQSSPDLREVQDQKYFDKAVNSALPSFGANNVQSQRTPNVPREEYKPPEILEENPLDEKFFAKPPWTPEERNARTQEYLQQGFLPEMAKSLAADDEQREISAPEAYAKRQEQLKNAKTEARSELMRKIELKTQKKGEDVFKDITGEMLSNIERGMERDLRVNPKATLGSVTEDWSNRAVAMAKAKDQLRTEAAQTGIENLFTGTKTFNKLKEYSDIFKRADNSEEYKNLLQSEFDLSAQGAASIAFPVSKPVKDYVSNYKFSPIKDPSQIENNARKAAIELEKHITPDQSVLSIAHELSQRDPFFDQRSFFMQLGEDKDRFANERQRLEISKGEKDYIPTWGDVKILPSKFRGR